MHTIRCWQHYFYHCNPNLLAWLQVSLYNVKSNGKRDYLSIGEDMLTTVFMVSFPTTHSRHQRHYESHNGIHFRTFLARLCCCC